MDIPEPGHATTVPPTAPSPATATGTGALAWSGSEVVPAADATVPLTDEGFLRGDAVFEAVLVRGGRTHALERHLARLRRSAAALELDLPEAPVRAAIAALLAAWTPGEGAVRVIVTRGGAVRGLITPVVWPPSISLGVVEVPWRTAISGVKTLSYAANQWVLRQARALGADDALIVTDGLVHELPSGSIVLVRDGTLSTPDHRRLPILDSVSVTVLAEVTPLTPTQPTMADLLAAEELLVVSATRPCLPVHALVLPDGTRRELPAPGPVTAAVQARLTDHLDATLDPAVVI